MTNILNKINKHRYRKLIVFSIVIIYTIFFSGCYTAKEFIVEGSQLRDVESYNDIKNVTLRDSTKIKFGDEELRCDAAYSNTFKNLKDVIVYTLKIDTLVEQVHFSHKLDVIEIKNVLKAKVTKDKFNTWLTVGVIGGAVVVLAAIVIISFASSKFNFHLDISH